MTTDQPRTQRRLAAILAADVVGFSVSWARTRRAPSLGSRASSEVIEPKVHEHHGRVFKTTGDGFLASSPARSRRCDAPRRSRRFSRPKPLRRPLRAASAPHGDQPRRHHRRGGWGCVRGRGKCRGAAGAARRAGGISVSGKVYEEVRDKLPYTSRTGGAAGQEHRAASPQLFARWRTTTGSPGKRRCLCSLVGPSLYCSPTFQEHQRRIPSRVYFSDGLTEDVITEMSRFRELMVIAQQLFVFIPRSKPRCARDRAFARCRIRGRGQCAARRRAASYHGAASALCVLALISGRSGTTAPLNDVFAIQEEIAQSIVATVVQRVVRDSEVAARRRVPENIRAYDLFLQGNHLTDAFAPEAQARAEVLFEQALQIDPGFARAHTGLAWIYVNRRPKSVRWSAPGERRE